MTINELEQGMRNLIATQPMVTSGVNGEVVNGVLSIIDAYRNLNFRVQSYPCQDVLKFTMNNESAKLENNLCNLVCQVMQERGINLMLYIAPPPNSYGQTPMVNQYGMINQQIDPNLMMGQMMYSQPQPQPMAQAPNPVMMQMPNQMGMGGVYNQMQPVGAGYGRTARRQAQTFPGYDYSNKPQKLEPVQKTEQIIRVRANSQSKVKAQPQPMREPSIKKVPVSAPVDDMPEYEPPVVRETSTQEPERMAPRGKSAGRDYLMELLKK